MEMEEEKLHGIRTTFGVIVRGNVSEIDKLLNFLKKSELIIIYHVISNEKLYIFKGDGNDGRKE